MITPVDYCFQWYTTLFISVLPFPFVLRVWDLFLSKGMVILFRISLAILKLLQKDLLSTDFEGIMFTLLNLTKTLIPIITVDDLITTACDFKLGSKQFEKLMAEATSSKSS